VTPFACYALESKRRSGVLGLLRPTQDNMARQRGRGRRYNRHTTSAAAEHVVHSANLLCHGNMAMAGLRGGARFGTQQAASAA
jgi:hypothetical protein